MTKEEFIGKVKDMLAMNAVYPDIKADLDSVIQQAIAEHEASEWKKYPEEKPEKAEWYLITDDEENIEADLWNNTDWANNPFVIAFRELPEPYQEGGEG